MSDRMPLMLAGLVTLAACWASLPVRAADASAAPAPAPAVAGAAVLPVAQLFGGKPLGVSALEGQRGGAQVVSDMRLKGVVADNEAVNVTTGSNFITDGAFSGAAGVPMVIQNSGNNVLIQNATVVNVQVK